MTLRSAVVLALLLTGCLQAGPGACSEEERAAFDSIEHFEDMGLVAEDHATGACAARFQTDDHEAVIEHYTRELEADGWEIGIRGTQPDGSPIEMEPGYLQAHQGEFSASVEIPLRGADAGTVTVLVGEGL